VCSHGRRLTGLFREIRPGDFHPAAVWTQLRCICYSGWSFLGRLFDVLVEQAPLAALDRQRAAWESALETNAAAVQRDVEFGELGGFERVALEEREEVRSSSWLGSGAGGAAHGRARGILRWSSSCDCDADSGFSEEEAGSVGQVAEAGGGGVIRGQCAGLDDLGEDVWRALPEVPPSFPCVVEHLDELRLCLLRHSFTLRLQNMILSIVLSVTSQPNHQAKELTAAHRNAMEQPRAKTSEKRRGPRKERLPVRLAFL
jgi:hypothetical protein